jgi:hypothetical protein
VSGFLGLTFLRQTLKRISLAQLPPVPVIRSDDDEHPPTRDEAVALSGALDRLEEAQALGRHTRSVFAIWMFVFGLVGAQMAWILRPFIGSPDRPFTWFRERGSNFFEAVWNILRNLIGAP